MVYSIAKYPVLLKEDSEEVYRKDSVGKLRDTSSYLQMDKIMKKLFTIHNKKPIIDFLNSIYKDNISYDAEIDYGNKEFINLHKYKSVYYSHYADMYIKVEDGENIYEYEIEFQTVHDEKMAIRLFRYGFEKAVEKADFSKLNEDVKEYIYKASYEKLSGIIENILDIETLEEAMGDISHNKK